MEKYISAIMTVVLAATIVTNIIVQVVKQLTWDKVPTNLLAFLVAQAVTLCSFFAACQIKCISVQWYLVVGAVALGFFVAFAAMFGFDKLKELVGQWGTIQKVREYREADK